VSGAPCRWRRPDRWGLAIWSAAILLVALRLTALGTAPPGLYQDEAAIGYNAWGVAHSGLDEHGTALPLFFESFGDFKSPVYFYLLAPLTWILPLTAGLVRLPAALCGLGVCALITATAHRISGGNRPLTLLALITAGLMPWLFLESRVGFEVVTLTLSLTATLWCLARAENGDGRRWFGAAGVALAVAIYAYPTGRLLVALLVPALCLAHLWRRRAPATEAGAAGRGWWLAIIPPLAGYAGLWAWAMRHPGALTARFETLSILADHPAPLTAVTRFAGNYLSHLGIPFLLVRGDANLRHSTGAGGLLLAAMVPALMAGALACWRRRQEPLPAFVLMGLLLAPIPASLTGEGIPHALRSAPMIPFLLVLCNYGWQTLLPWLSRGSHWRTALLAIAAVQVTLYQADLHLTYPDRAATAFDVGLDEAIVAAQRLSNGHMVFLSTNLGQPYAHALFSLRPLPGRDLRATMASIHMRQLPVDSISDLGRAGDIAILSPVDQPPPQAQPLLTQRVPTAWGNSAPGVTIYRL